MSIDAKAAEQDLIVAVQKFKEIEQKIESLEAEITAEECNMLNAEAELYVARGTLRNAINNERQTMRK